MLPRGDRTCKIILPVAGVHSHYCLQLLCKKAWKMLHDFRTFCNSAIFFLNKACLANIFTIYAQGMSCLQVGEMSSVIWQISVFKNLLFYFRYYRIITSKKNLQAWSSFSILLLVAPLHRLISFGQSCSVFLVCNCSDALTGKQGVETHVTYIVIFVHEACISFAPFLCWLWTSGCC